MKVSVRTGHTKKLKQNSQGHIQNSRLICIKEAGPTKEQDGVGGGSKELFSYKIF